MESTLFVYPLRLMILSCLIVSITGCTTAITIDYANREEVHVKSYYSGIKSATLVNDTIALKITREQGEDETFCFTKQDFETSLIRYPYQNTNRPYTCSDELINGLEHGIELTPISSIKTGFVIPELDTVIYGKKNDSITTRCDCELLKNINSKPKEVVTFSNSLFYIELENGGWVKFEESEATPSLRILNASLSNKIDFDKDMEVHKGKVSYDNFNILNNKVGSYLFIRLPNSKEHIYSYHIDDPSFSSFPIMSVVIEDDKKITVKAKEANYWLMAGLLP